MSYPYIPLSFPTLKSPSHASLCDAVSSLQRYQSLLPAPRPIDLSRALSQHLTALRYFDAAPWEFKTLLEEKFKVSPRDLRKEVHSMIDALVATEIRPICEAVSEKLPRELRDVVYDILLRELDSSVETTITFPGPLDPMKLRRGVANPTVPTHCFFFQQKYVGATTQREMVQSWYRTRRFRVEGNWGMMVRGLEAILREDMFKFGVRGFVPADHITHLTIPFHPGTHNSGTLASLLLPSPVPSLLAASPRLLITIQLPSALFRSAGLMRSETFATRFIFFPMLEEAEVVARILVKAGCTRVHIAIDEVGIWMEERGEVLGREELWGKAKKVGGVREWGREGDRSELLQK